MKKLEDIKSLYISKIEKHTELTQKWTRENIKNMNEEEFKAFLEKDMKFWYEEWDMWKHEFYMQFWDITSECLNLFKNTL